MDNAHRQEARLIGRYLLGGEEPIEAALVLYEQAIERLAITLSVKDQKLLQRALKQSFLLPLVDAGLALSNPKSGLRRRVFVMSAILETQPVYAARFLPFQQTVVQHVFALFSAFFSGLRAALGFILVKLIA